MTHTKSSALALLAAVVLSCGSARAQQNNSATENPPATDAALREKAIDLLQTLAGEMHILQSAENRARIGSNIAASLWKHDEKRARALLVLVEEEIKTALAKPVSDDEPSDAQTRLVFFQLRVETVERIAGLDPDLAMSFLKATESTSESKSPYGIAEIERGLELRLAKTIAANNPDMALKLGRQSLARGFSNDLLVVLRQLHRKHKEQAQSLYKEIVAKLRNVDFANNPDVFQLAQSVALSFQPPRVEAAAYRELIGLFIASALENGCDKKKFGDEERSVYCSQIGQLFPQMAQVDPSRAAKLKHWEGEPEEGQSTSEAFEELNEVSQNGTVEDALALVRKYPEIEGDIYFRAIELAMRSGDFARARKMTTDHISDPETKEELLAGIERAEKWTSLDDERLAEFRKELETIPPQPRVGMMLFMASQIGGKDRRVGLKLLDDASAIIETMKPGKEQTEAQLRLAMLYCWENSDRGFAIMESLLPKLNELVNASAKLDGYDNSYLREGEWNMSNVGSAGTLLTGMAQNAVYFAWRDFGRAVSLASQFERPELRMMAQLKLAQGILAGRPKRPMLDEHIIYD